MTDDQNTLDERAVAAAADLRNRAEARPRPAFDPTHVPDLEVPAIPAGGSGPHRTRFLLAAAAVLLLVVALGAAWLGTRSTEDSGPDPVGTETTGSIRGWEATDLPDGLELAGAAETGPGGDDETGTVRLPDVEVQAYGPEPDQPTVGVAWIDGFDAAEGFDVAGRSLEEITVDGRKAYAADDGMFGRRAVIVPGDGGAVLVLSPVLERDDLISLLPDVTVAEGRATLDTAATSLRLAPLGRELLYTLVSPALGGGLNPTRLVVYADASSEHMVSVSAVAGDEAQMHLPALVGTDVRRTTVRGHDAVLGDIAGMGSFLTWIERPGEVVRLVGYGVDQPGLVQVAGGLKPLSEPAFDDLVDRSRLGDFDSGSSAGEDDDQIEVARGRFDDGLAWVVRVGADGGEGDPPDLQVALSGDSSSGSSAQGTQISGPESEPPAMRGTTELDQGGRRFAAGFVGPEVDRVELRRLDGTVLATPEVLTGGGYRLWVAELPEGTAWAVGLRADGSEAGRQTISGGGAPEDTIPDPAGPTTVVSGSGGD